jgi:glycosyltransferase involved in cell wall biosynthesis
MYEYGVRNVDCVLVQNQAQKEEVRRKFGRDAILVPNYYQSTDSGKGVSNVGVLWTSTIRKVKRPNLFLDLAEALPEIQFTMVGGSSDKEAVLYDQIAERASSMRNVNFVGFVPYAKVHEYFHAAKLFVNTSASEGFPNTFLQSWARGVPTISFVECGARWHGRPIGEIVSSIDDMKEKVEYFLRDDQFRGRVGAECQQYVNEHHSSSKVLDLYEAVFDNLEN